MKALLLNDTRTEDHIGCQLGIENILLCCQKNNIHIIDTVKLGEDPCLRVQEKLNAFDTIILNGEGTMHHDAPRALKYMIALKMAKSANKKCVIINSVWQDNFLLNQFLDSCDLIFCREGLSAKEINKQGKDCQVVPDMTFYKDLPPNKTTYYKDILVVDSVDKSFTKKLWWFAFRNRFRFLAMTSGYATYMNKYKLRRLLSFLSFGGVPPKPGKVTLPLIEGSQKIVTGRFHAICLAMLYKKAFAAFSSNTHKVEGLLNDIGLPTEIILSRNEPLDKSKILNALAACDQKSNLIDEYITSSRKKIDEMFFKISQL